MPEFVQGAGGNLYRVPSPTPRFTRHRCKAVGRQRSKRFEEPFVPPLQQSESFTRTQWNDDPKKRRQRSRRFRPPNCRSLPSREKCCSKTVSSTCECECHHRHRDHDRDHERVPGEDSAIADRHLEFQASGSSSMTFPHTSEAFSNSPVDSTGLLQSSSESPLSVAHPIGTTTRLSTGVPSSDSASSPVSLPSSELSLPQCAKLGSNPKSLLSVESVTPLPDSVVVPPSLDTTLPSPPVALPSEVASSTTPCTTTAGGKLLLLDTQVSIVSESVPHPVTIAIVSLLLSHSETSASDSSSTNLPSGVSSTPSTTSTPTAGAGELLFLDTQVSVRSESVPYPSTVAVIVLLFSPSKTPASGSSGGFAQ
ncbi:hypothetical protein K435DRAFT_417410 [Dendrothele bispora CBS 962.96]|uniref:Uncharacterized protein n=1 Tax=Dendrothele bispora (strain CBS 962.96) TaxID=1314807 RepID=A0A4S8MV42_DENBC|nr:hypothetical protein K435DRAFT_417410 [Dendrothele bispora CBS 962.96]